MEFIYYNFSPYDLVLIVIHTIYIPLEWWNKEYIQLFGLYDEFYDVSLTLVIFNDVVILQANITQFFLWIHFYIKSCTNIPE